MKTKLSKKILSFALACMMVLGVLPVSAMAESQPITVGIDGSSPTIISFGGKKWAVIGYNDGVNNGVGAAASDSNTMTLLLADGQSFKRTQFYPNRDRLNHYSGSDLQIAMNNSFNELSPEEKAVIKKRDIAGEAAYDFGNPSDNVAGEAITEAGFWPLSVKEARLVNIAALRFAADWWLRSPGIDDPNYPNAANVSEFGNVWADGRYITNCFGVRPAFNLNLESVIFTSAAEGGKSFATVGNGLFDAVVHTGALKLTIVDSNMAAPTLTLTETTNGTNAIGFDYSGAQTGENRYISCVLEDSNGKVKYYGKLADCTSNVNGNLTISLAGVAKNETYTLKIFSEQEKGDNLTDYASAPITKKLTVDASGNGKVDESAEGSSISATYDGGNIVSGAVVLAGKELVITVEGKDSDSYTYAWSGTGTSGQTTNSITINSLSNKVEATCTVSGLNKKEYIVTFSSNEGSDVAAINVASGNKITIPTAPTKEGYTFNGWYKEAALENVWNFATEVVTANITLYARWTKNEPTDPTDPTNPGTNQGDNGGGSTTPAPTPTPTPVPETKVEAGRITTTIPVKPTMDTTGKAVAEISEKQLADAIARAETEAAKLGKKSEIIIGIEVTASADSKMVGIELTAEALQNFVDSEADKLEVSTPFGTMTFDDKAAKGILKQFAGIITITASKVEKAEMTAKIREKVGDRPVVSFDVTSKGKEIAQLGGKATVTIPYTLKTGENPNAILVYDIKSIDKSKAVKNCKYDPTSEMISFETADTSKFAVGHNKVSFADVVEGAWYYDAVTFAAAREITAGTGNGNFGSNDNVTRVQALVMIMKAFGISPDENAENNFSDAGNTYYTGYLAAAKNLGITSGVGIGINASNEFAPDRQVTRQELFVLAYNTLKNMNELPTASTANDLADFKDSEKVADYANKAVELFVKTGIIFGTNGSILPEDSASRAQFVQILYNIMMK